MQTAQKKKKIKVSIDERPNAKTGRGTSEGQKKEDQKVRTQKVKSQKVKKGIKMMLYILQPLVS